MNLKLVRRAFACLALAAVPLAAPSSAFAWGYGYGGYGFGGLNYSLYAQDPIPYFSLHPPVYYSYPVARPYGLSPFASPPVVMRPAAPAQPIIISNQFVESSREPAASETVTAMPEALTIQNPFVGAAEGDGGSSSATVVTNQFAAARE